jgi:hypothetical protein
MGTQREQRGDRVESSGGGGGEEGATFRPRPASPAWRRRLPFDSTERPRSTSGAYAIAAIFFVIAAGIVPVGIWMSYPLTNHDPLTQFLQIGIVVYAAGRLAFVIAAKEARWFEMTVYSFVYTIFGTSQLVQLSVGENPLRVDVSDGLANRQLTILIVGCLVFDVAYAVSRRRFSENGYDPPRQRVASLRRVVEFSIFVLAVSPLLIRHFGGLSSLFSSRQTVADQLGISLAEQKTDESIIIAFSNVAPFLALFSLVRLRQAGAFQFRKRPTLGLLAGLLLADNVILNNPVSQPRYWVATVLIGFVFIARRFQGAVGMATVAATMIFISTIIFPYLDRYRYSGQPTDERHSAAYFFVNKTDYASNVDLTNTIVYVDRHGHTDGKQLLTDTFFFVPRTYWPEKADDTGQLLAIDINYPNLNLDAPLWGEAYIDFGIPGVVVVFGLYGVLASRMERRLLRIKASQSATWAALALPSLTGYQLIILRGSLLQATGRLSVMVLVLLLLTRSTKTKEEGGQRHQDRTFETHPEVRRAALVHEGAP